MTILIIVFLIGMGPLTKYLQDRSLLMIGHLMTGVSIALTVLFMALSNRRSTYIPVWQLSVACGIFVCSIPFYESVLGSLFSKLLNDPSLNARGQSVMATSKSVGSILGPLVSGLIFPKGVIFVEGLMGVLWFLVYLLLIFAWRSMDVSNFQDHRDSRDSIEILPGIFLFLFLILFFFSSNFILSLLFSSILIKIRI